MCKKITVHSVQQKTKSSWVAATAYHAAMAQLIDPIVDIILVGDSLDMVLNHQPNTTRVSLETMNYHAKSVASACQHALVVVDMPFGSYHTQPEEAFKNAHYLLSNSGCQAVKLEINKTLVPTVHFLTQRGIPVMAHIGLLPQHVQKTGFFKRNTSDNNLVELAIKAQEMGAFCILVECVDAKIIHNIKFNVTIPVIGIGSTNDCDGQIAVTEDLLGLSQNTPSFIPQYANLKKTIQEALQKYKNDVNNKKLYK